MIHPPGARPTRPVPGGRRLRATVVLKPSELPPGHPVAKKVQRILSSRSHRRPTLSREEYEDYQCADEAHVDAIRRFAAPTGWTSWRCPAPGTTSCWKGRRAPWVRRFASIYRHFAHAGRVYRGHRGPVHVPAGLREAVIGVLGLDNLVRVNRPARPGPSTTRPGRGRFGPVRRLLPLPSGHDREGQRVALIELAGGYHPGDVAAYFKKLGVERPAISDACVSGARNHPLDRETVRQILTAKSGSREVRTASTRTNSGALRYTVEVTMDLESVCAPNAEFVVIFAPGDGRGLYQALHKAMDRGGVGDFAELGLPGVRGPRAPTPPALNRVLHDAGVRGVTARRASGDDGSRATGEHNANGLANVNFPASSPYTLACGGTSRCCSANGSKGKSSGTRLSTAPGSPAGAASAAGSRCRPTRRGANVPRFDGSSPKKTWLSHETASRGGHRGRGVPDVAANADFDTGYEIVVGGVDYHGFGTSAAAPLWAALIARLNEGLMRARRVIGTCITPRPPAFRPITQGDNDVCDGRMLFYRARCGWCGCTGLGTPDGVLPPAPCGGAGLTRFGRRQTQTLLNFEVRPGRVGREARTGSRGGNPGVGEPAQRTVRSPAPRPTESAA